MIFGRKSTPKGLLVRSTLTKEDFERVYRLLDCPVLNFDCGDLCDRRCCQEYEPGVGIYLLPGEECMFTGQEAWLAWTYHKAARHGFPKEWKGKIQFVTCKGRFNAGHFPLCLILTGRTGYLCAWTRSRDRFFAPW